MRTTSFMIGLMMGLPLAITIQLLLGGYFNNFDNVEIKTYKSFENELNSCKSDYSNLKLNVDKLKEQNKVVCEYKEPIINYLMLPMGFILGALGMCYWILYGYPLFKKKIEERKKQ